MRSIALAASVFVARTIFASPADDIVSHFVDVLRQDSLAQLAMLVDDQQKDPHAWDDLRDLVDRFDCIRVDRFASTIESSAEDRIALRVELEGDAELKAVWRPCSAFRMSGISKHDAPARAGVFREHSRKNAASPWLWRLRRRRSMPNDC